MYLVKLQQLDLGYGVHKVIKGLNLEIKEGDFICVVGPNGSGKTTLLKALLGLVRPLSGELLYGALERQAIGYMPQALAVDERFPATVAEVVGLGTLNRTGARSLGRADKQKLIRQALRTLAIERLEKRSFAELSGGQRQRVLLARALVAGEKLLVLDEVTNNLDYETRERLHELLTKLNREKGLAIIMATHDLDHGNLLGKSILSLRPGDIFFGSRAAFVKKVHNE